MLEPLLSIPTPTEQSHLSIVERELPRSWNVDVDTAREEVAWTLQTLSANALELAQLWARSGFSSSLLVDVEGPAFTTKLPMQIDSFRSYQMDCSEGIKSNLWTSWAPKTMEIFSRIPPIFINGDAEAYYRSIATLQVRHTSAPRLSFIHHHLSFILFGMSACSLIFPPPIQSAEQPAP